MSENTLVTETVADETVVAPVEQNAPEQTPEPTLPVVPDTDDDLRTRAQFATRVSDLLTIANSDVDNRAALDQRAFNVAARALSVSAARGEYVDHDSVLMHARDDIDAETGRGKSQRFHYPRERAELLIAVAELLGTSALLTHRTYAYSGSRRQYRVELWGLPSDVKRVIALTALLDSRMLSEIARLEFEPGTSPAQQTVAKRKFVRDYTATVSEMLNKITDTLDEKTQNAISDRKTAADAARDEFTAQQNAELQNA